MTNQRIRNEFRAWCQFALAPLGFMPALHHRFMIAELQKVADGVTSRLMLLFPPGSAKSTYGVKLFAAYWLARFPKAQIIAGAHTQTLAEKFSYDIQKIVRDNAATLGYGLATEAKELWITTSGGQYRAAGVGTKITGFRANIALLDDLVPGAEGADSPTQRDALWDWYISELDSRMTPGAPRVLIMTRWHEDDIAGRLLRFQKDAWRVVSIPALAETNDPLGRAVGEPLWADDNYGYGAQMIAKRDELYALGRSRDWWALYQQQPRAPEGAMFKTQSIKAVDEIPPASQAYPDVRAWDLAATADGGDATVGVRMRRLPGIVAPRFVVVDVKRLRGSPERVAEAIVETARMDGRSGMVRIPQDPGQAGKQQVSWLTGLLAGYRVVSAPVTGNKETRAGPSASQVNVGAVDVLRAEWNAAFLSELAAFPNGREDDQVDAFSDAFEALMATRGPIVTKSALEASRHRIAIHA